MSEPTKKCARCGRALHSDVGIALGMGPVCFGKRVKNPTWKEFESLGQLRLFGEVPEKRPEDFERALSKAEKSANELMKNIQGSFRLPNPDLNLEIKKSDLGVGWGRIWQKLKSIKLD